MCVDLDRVHPVCHYKPYSSTAGSVTDAGRKAACDEGKSSGADKGGRGLVVRSPS